MSEITWCATSMCLTCGRTVKHKPFGGPQRFHWCRVRFISRWRRRIHAAAWEAGYRFAVDHIEEPMVYADVTDYGTGWAGVIKAGGITISAGDGASGQGTA